MQRSDDGFLLFSPSDLTEFLESPFASWMSRAALDDPTLVRVQNPTAELLRKKGDEHEREVLTRMRDVLGLDVAEIAFERGREAAARAATREAVAAGRDVIFQAALASSPFAGLADFLVHPRVAAYVRGDATAPDPEASGPYEVWDAKLARSVKPAHLVQLCAYAEMLAPLQQGVRPERLTIALGDRSFASVRVEDCIHHYRALRARFIAAQDAFDPGQPPLPAPSENHRGWAEAADARLEEIDHPTRVARLTAAQAKKLAEADIPTMRALAETKEARVRGIAPQVFARLREQARLQRDSEGQEQPQFRVLGADEVEAGKGLACLPPASPGDVFFDIEGYPLGVDGGLEYLWGVAYLGDGGEIAYRAFWAHDPGEERAAFEDFLDWVAERRAAHPDLHVYHYASYEKTALKKLMGRTGSREAAVDTLLREEVLVDLYPIVTNGVRIGEPRYSIKNVEKLYRGAREGEVTDGMQSVLEYERFLEMGEPRDVERSPILQSLEHYNRDDCVSTFELATWLRARQAEAGIGYGNPPEPDESEERDRSESEELRAQRTQQAEKLRRKAGEEPAEEDTEAHERWRVGTLLADLLEFHAREARPVYWELHERAEMTVDERREQAECLAGLRRTGRAPFRIARSQGYEYRFDPKQETRVREDDSCRCAQERRLAVRVHELDLHEGRVVLKVTKRKLVDAGLDDLPEALCLIRFDTVSTKKIEESLDRTAAAWLERDVLSPALADLLHRARPRLADAREAAGPLRFEDEAIGDAMQRIVESLDSSTLCVQGPPGSGKTRQGGGVIAALARTGKSVAVSSQSHSAIVNLLRSAGRAARGTGEPLDLVKVGGKTPEEQTVAGEPQTERCESADVAGRVRAGTVVGATPWCLSRHDLEGAFDVLFVDEAGQVSLANVVAMAPCARNLVLLGDPAQLAQPLRGTHPGESGQAALEYALAPTDGLIDERKGLFLADTYRLHPRICRYISESFYAGRLRAAKDHGNENRVLRPRAAAGAGGAAASLDAYAVLDAIEAGIAFVAVEHEANSQESVEEVDAIRTIVTRLEGRRLRDRHGRSERPLTRDDMLIVAPYNLQVRALQEALPGIEVGTVDRFQGREAPVVIVSLTASDAAAAPRGLGFLLARDRLNVAVSRAETLAVVVGSPGLGEGGAGSVAELEAVNRFWGLVEAGRLED